MSYDKSIAFSKLSSQRVWSRTFYSNFKYLLVFLKLSVCYRRLVPNLPSTSMLLFVFPVIMCLEGSSRTLLNPKVHCRIHKRPPPVPNSEPQYIRWSPSHFLKTLFNIIVPSTPTSCTWYDFFAFYHQNALSTSPLPYTCHMPLLSHPSCFDHLNNMCCIFQNIILFVM